eukprot:IDg20636t1
MGHELTNTHQPASPLYTTPPTWRPSFLKTTIFRQRQASNFQLQFALSHTSTNFTTQSATSELKRKRFRFIESYDVLLLRAVLSVDAHVSERADRFQRNVAHRREVVKKTSKASRIFEKYEEKEVLLDDLIQKID